MNDWFYKVSGPTKRQPPCQYHLVPVPPCQYLIQPRDNHPPLSIVNPPRFFAQFPEVPQNDFSLKKHPFPEMTELAKEQYPSPGWQAIVEPQHSVLFVDGDVVVFSGFDSGNLASVWIPAPITHLLLAMIVRIW